MQPNIHLIKYPDRLYQICPLCGERQIISVRGVAPDLENGSLHILPDRGYSFCNCWNIFYTDWKNIRQEIYDETYVEKYNCDDPKNIAEYETKKWLALINKFNPHVKTFFEIGAVQDFVMDVAKSYGINTVGLDIARVKSKHPLITANFEDYQPVEKFDVVWASHVFEHFKDPRKQLLKIKDMLNEKGIVYVAMPDTFFINFSGGNIYCWDWNVIEHHILWCMDSFVDFAESLGYECLFRERSTDLFKESKTSYQVGNVVVPKPTDTWFWKQDFKVLLCRAQ